MGAVLHQGQSFLVQITPQVAAENSGGGLRQGAIHIHIEIGHGLHQVLVLNLPDEIQQLLGAPHGKGGDDHVAALAQRFVDDLRQLVGVAPDLGVVAVAVGALHDHEVRLMEELRVADDGLIHVANVAGEDDGAHLAALGDRQLHAGGAKQMAGINALHADALAQIHLFAVFAGGEKFLHPQSVLHGVQRLHHRPAGAEVLAVLVFGVGLLNVRRVLQHDVHELGGEAGGEDAPLKALLYKHGNAAGVVDVGVGHQHIVDLACVEGQAAVVHLVPSLLQAAVDEDLFAVCLQTVAAAGDALVSAEKAQFHSGSSFLASVVKCYLAP